MYRRTHIAHHQCDALTDPVNDPESFYWNEKDWSRLTVMLRYLYRFNQTLSGRMLVGPWLFVIQFLWGELRRILSGDRLAWREWSFHALLLTPVIFWIVVVAQVPLWKYVICFSWPGLSLTLLRSFAEHRPARLQEERSVVVEGSWFTRLLFLGNNYHALHHARADIPWYRMRAEFVVGRKALLDQNRNYYFRSYLELFKRYAFRAKDDPVVQS